MEEVKRKRGRPKGSKNPAVMQTFAVTKGNQKLTPEVQARILEAVRIGCYFSSAAAAAGIHANTLGNWMKWGEQGLEPYKQFRDEMLLAEEASEEELVKMWKAHMPKNWQAVAAFLERRRPEKWSRRDYSKVENQTDIKMQVMYVNEWRGDPQIIDVTPTQTEKEGSTNGGDKHDSKGSKAEGQDDTTAETVASSDSNTDESGKV